MFNTGYDLAKLTASAIETRGLRRADLRPGDVMVVKTRNSVYAVRALDSGQFCVSGGWFDRNFAGNFVTTIIGCTWGGTAVNRDVVAAYGMHLEFGQRVTTSVILSVSLFRSESLN